MVISIYGGSGSGKTTLATALQQYFLNDGMGEGDCGKEDLHGQHARLSRRHPASGFKGTASKRGDPVVN